MNSLVTVRIRPSRADRIRSILGRHTKEKRRCLKMAKKAKRGSAFQYTVLGYTQTRVQQKAALKLSFCRECEEIEL
ncbi:MAG: hypothetical protein IJD60_00070, partial [Clostridia bacterium]|nr:hypothetical protein [Clostridia bacterium]